MIPLEVSFNAPQENNNDISSYQWDFGNENSVVESLETNTTYEQKGIYEIILSAIYEDGSKKNFKRKIAVSEKTVSFITFGDWGWGDDVDNQTAGDSQKSVASAIDTFCQNNECQFILTLGDNFYLNGVKSTQDPQWDTKYKEVYKNIDIPFCATIGNHDLESIESEINYTTVDDKWYLPNNYYTISFSPLIDIFVITSQNFLIDKEMQSFLQDALSISQAQWKILAMNNPLISPNGIRENMADINNTIISVSCNQVDLTLSGQVHGFAHLTESVQGCSIDQLIIGTGGAPLGPINEDLRLKASGSFYGFGWLQASESKLTFSMIDTDGNVVYSTEWSP